MTAQRPDIEHYKKRVQSSHLALRFYKHDGWTKETLDKYVIRGRVIDQREGQEVRDYWWLDHEQGSQLDMERHTWIEETGLGFGPVHTDQRKLV